MALGTLLGIPSTKVHVDAAVMSTAYRLRLMADWWSTKLRRHSTVMDLLKRVVPEIAGGQDFVKVSRIVEGSFMMSFPDPSLWQREHELLRG